MTNNVGVLLVGDSELGGVGSADPVLLFVARVELDTSLQRESLTWATDGRGS